MQRPARWLRFLDDVVADVRYAGRTLRRAPLFAVTAIVVLAVGLGATTALHSAVRAFLLDSLPVADPGRLVRLRWAGNNPAASMTLAYGYTDGSLAGVSASFSYPSFEELRATTETLDGVVAAAPFSLNVIADEEPELASGLFVSGEYFDLLGVRARLGRTLEERDDDPTAAPVAAISHAYWLRRFGGDPGIVGTVVEANGTAVTVVGVLPPEYRGVQRPDERPADVHLPLQTCPRLRSDGEQCFAATHWWLQVMGRLRPGATVEQVQGELTGTFKAAVEAARDASSRALSGQAQARSRRGGASDADGDQAPRLLVSAGGRGIYDPDPRVRRQAAILGAVVTLLLLVVCTNVANLLLSRAATRRREIALRRSVGATRGRVVRQLVTEGLVLSALGGALGILVAIAARRFVPFGQTASIDWRTLGFVAAASLGTGVAFSLVPALRATGAETASALKESSRSVARSTSLLARALLVVQVAASVVLLVGSGLLLRTLANLRAVDVGFDRENLLLFSVDPRLNRYDAPGTEALYARIAETVGALPGVRSVSLSSVAFLTGSMWTTSLVIEREDGEPESRQAHLNTISPQFFAAMGIPLLSGRVFDQGDREDAPPVAIVNESAARQLFGDRGAVGRRFGNEPDEPREIEVVGIVGDVKYHDVRAGAPATIYRPHAQWPQGGRVFEVKTAVPPRTLLPAVNDAVRRVDRSLPLLRVSTQAEEIEKRFAQEKLLAGAYSLFGGLAMFLAAVGLFGLTSYGVAQRTGEVGVRMALGARGSDIRGMILRESLALVGIGVAIGVAGAVLAGRVIESLLYELSPAHVPTLLAATVAMTAVAALAAYLPALRASRIDPLEALRSE